MFFFQRFDKEANRAIRYSEFCEAFASKDETCLKELAKREPQNLNLEVPYNELFD